MQGKNINVTSTTGSNGQTVYTVKTADDVNFNTLTTTGNTSIGGALTVTGNANLNNGANLNNKKITGLANGTADSDAVNYGQIKNLVIGSNYDGIQYFRTKSTKADANSLGEDSTAIGPLATANGDNSIAVGNTSQANGLGSISVGQKSIAYQENNVAIGKESAALGKYSTAIGASTGQPRTPVLTNDSNNNNQLTAIDGIPVTATGSTPDTITEINGTAVTPDQRNAFIALLSSGANLAGGEASLALGTSNLATGNSSVALGSMNSSSATSSVALGSNNNANGSSSIAIGDRNSASASNAVAIGTQASSSRSNTIAIGKGAIADTSSGITIGENAGVGSSQGSTTDRVEHIAIGKNSGQNVVGNQNIAIGSGAGSNLSPDNDSSSDSNIAIGIAAGSGINGDDNISIGRNSNTNGGAITRSVTLGSETKSSSQSVVVGNSSKVTSGTDATIVGYNAQVTGTGGIALGANTQAAANNIALGINSDASTNSTTKAYLVSDTIPDVATVGYSVVSVGNGTTTRRITNVAPGGNPTDAVNVSQLTQLHNDVSSILGLTGSTDGKFGEVNVNGTTYGSIIAAIAAGGGGGGTLPTDYYVTYTNQAQNEINLGPNGGKGTTINNVATATNDDQAVNLGQVKALAKDATVKYVSINSIDGANKLSDQAIANNSVAIGPSTGTTAVAENSIALGSNVRTEALNGIAIGNSGTRAKGESSIAIGKENTTADINNIALGTLVSTKGIDSIGIGKNVQTDATSSTTNYAIAIGSDAEVQNSDQAIVIGRKAIVSQDNGVAIGNEALTQGEQGISIGRQATSSAENTTAIGNKASSSGQSANAIGDNAKAQAKDSNAMGTAANASALNALALGTGASASSENSTAIGNQARASASDAVAFGNGAVSQAQQEDPITGLPLSNTPSISLGGINAGNQIISNVAPGKNGTDAVNVNQLNDVKAIAEEGWVFTTATSGKGQTVNSSLQTIKPNQRFTMISGDNVELIQNGDKVTITTTPEVNFDKVTVGNVVIDKTTNKITGVEAGTIAANSKDVVNGSQLHDLGSGVQNIIGGNTTYDPNTGTYTNNNIGDTGQNNINDAIKSINDTAQNANKGWTVSTNGQNASQVKPTDTVDFANKDGNIKVNNTGNNITVDLAKDIQVDSVKAGDTTVNNNGLTINGGPSVTKNGIDAAGNKVTGVAEGSIAQGSKDAVNGSQIHDIIGDGAFQGGDGNTITNIGGTGATNINDAIGSINQKAGQHSTVEAGQNITVKESTNSNGGKEYTVATADDVKFNSVTSNTVTANNVKVGDVTIDQNGINAGNHKITNVAPGEISSTSKDAVNGSQLNTSNQYIVNSLGGGAKYENGQFTGPTYNVNNGSYNNVGDALGALNQADINLGNRITNLGDRLEQVFYNVNGRIDDVEKKANAGIASAMALEGAPFVAGKFTYAVGAAYHGGENAVGATLRKTADNGRWSITGGVAAASQGDPSVRVGISGVID